MSQGSRRQRREGKLDLQRRERGRWCCYKHLQILPSQPGPCRGEIQLPGGKLRTLRAHQGGVGTGNGGTGTFWKESRVLMLFLILPSN